MSDPLATIFIAIFQIMKEGMGLSLPQAASFRFSFLSFFGLESTVLQDRKETSFAFLLKVIDQAGYRRHIVQL